MQLQDGHRRPCAPAPLRGPLSSPHRLDGHPLAKRGLATYAHTGQRDRPPADFGFGAKCKVTPYLFSS